MTQQKNITQYHSFSGTESGIEQSVISESAWQRWQTCYAIMRTETFQRIVEAQAKLSAL